MKRAIETPYVQVDANLRRDPDFLAFAAHLRPHMPAQHVGAWKLVAHSQVITVWGEFLEHCPSGCPRDVTRDTIEEWAGWEGTPGAFVDAFMAHLCTGDGDECRIRGWAVRYGKLAAKRAQTTQRQRNRRARLNGSDASSGRTDGVPESEGEGQSHTGHAPVTRDTVVTGHTEHADDDASHALVTRDPSYCKSKDKENPPPPSGGGTPSAADRATAFGLALDRAVAEVPHGGAQAAMRQLLDETGAAPEKWQSLVSRMAGWHVGLGTTGLRKISWDAIAEGIGELLDANDPGQRITPAIVLIFVERAHRRRTTAPPAETTPSTGQPAEETDGAMSAAAIASAIRNAQRGDARWIDHCRKFGINYEAATV